MATGGGERTARRAAIALLVVVTANTLGTRAAYNASCAAHSAYMAAPQLADGSATVVATVAGGAGHGISGFGNGHALRSALLNFPGGLLVHPATGTVLVADNQNQRVRALSTDGTMTTFAGSGSTGSSDNTNPLLATFNEPAGVVLDLAADVLFVSEQAGHVIRRVAGVVDGAGAVSTYAGTGAGAYLDASRLSARFKAPNGLALDESRQILYVADRTNGRIRIVNLTSGDVTTERSGLSDPTDVKVHPLTPRYLYVTCFTGQTVIRRDVISGAEFTVTSSIGYTIGVAVAFAAGPSGSDVLFVSTGHRVYRINGDGTGSAVLAGGVSSGLTNGSAASARFTSPTGLAIDTASGSLIVADTGNNALRTITHATTPCRQSTASRSPTVSLTAPRSRTLSLSRSPSWTVARTRSSSVTVLRTPSHTTSLSRSTRHPSATHSHTLAPSPSALATASRGNSTMTATKSPTVTPTATPRPAFNTTTSPPATTAAATTTTSPAAPTAAVTTPPPQTSTSAAGPSSSPASTTSSPTAQLSSTTAAATVGPTTAVVSTTRAVSSPPAATTDSAESTLLPTPSPPATTPRGTSAATTTPHATTSTAASTGTPSSTNVPSPPNITSAVPTTEIAPSTAAVTVPATPLLRTTLTFRLSGDRWRHALALRGSYVRDAVTRDLAAAYGVANATRDVEVSNVTVGSLVVVATVSHSLTNRSSAAVLRDAPFHRTIAEYADAGAADAASVALLEVDAVDTLWSVPVPPPTSGATGAPDDDASSNPVAALFDDCGVTCVALLVVCGLVVAAIVAAAVAVVVASMRRADDTSRPSSADGIAKDAGRSLDADASLPCDVEGDGAASASGRAASNPLILVAPPLNLGSDGEFSDREADADGGGSRRLRFNVAKNSVVLYDPKSPASPLMSLDGSERPSATRGAPDADDAAQHSIGGARSSTSAEDSSTSSARAYLDLRSPPPPPPERHRPFDVHTALMVTHAPRGSGDAGSGCGSGRFRLPRRAASDDPNSAAPRVRPAPRPAFAEEVDSPITDAPVVEDAPLPPPAQRSAARRWADASVDSLDDEELPPQSPAGVVLTFATPPPGSTSHGC